MEKHGDACAESDGTGVSGSGQGKPLRVLVVDDDPWIRELAERILTQRGYRVTTCSESVRAIDMLREGPYGCVLLDIRMAGLQGTELLLIIKHNFAALPVIIVSSYCAPADAAYYGSLGAFDLVPKPFDGDLLVDAVNRAVGVTQAIPLVLTSLSLIEAREQVYRKLIVAALQRAHWNQIKAAQLLGVSRHCLIRWLRKLQISY